MDVEMLVLFAHWCPKCNMMMPIVDELEIHYQKKLQVRRIDVDKEPGAMEKYHAELVPTFILRVREKEVGRMAGLIGEKIIYDRINKFLQQKVFEV